MHENQGIFDGIDVLFRLNEGEFDPAIHFEIADRIVALLNYPPLLFSVYDLFECSSSTQRYESERRPFGQYVVCPRGRLDSAVSLGLHPKIEITYWKDRLFKPTQREELTLSYEKEHAIGIRKSVVYEGELCSVPLGQRTLSFLYAHSKKVWLFKR